MNALDSQLADWLCERAGGADAALRSVALCLTSACEQGSLCLPAEATALAEALSALEQPADPGGKAAPPSPENTPALAENFLQGVQTGRYAAVLGSATDPKPLILHRNRLYFHRHFRAEEALAKGLLALLSQDPVPPDLNAAQAVLRRIESDLAPMKLAEKQQWALAAALRERVFILSGGPGTGKTALTAALLRAFVRLRGPSPARIRLCAPTGRAAQRLEESLRANLGAATAESDRVLSSLRVETVHRLLGYHPASARFARHEGDPLEADLVLVDEASMADVFTLSALVRALPPSASLILVGDADQLPAVEAGSVLGELLGGGSRLSPETWKWIAACFPEATPAPADRLPRQTLPAVLLDRSHRSRQAILDLAAAINAGDAETLLASLGSPRSPGDGSSPFPEREGGLRRFEIRDEKTAADLDAFLERFAEDLFHARKIGGRTYAEWLAAAREAASEDEEEAMLANLWAFLGQSRILACARRGMLGCERINARLTRKLTPRFDPGAPTGATPAFHGAPLLVTRNDTQSGLSNGEVGVWLRRASGLTACFPRPGKSLRLSPVFLPAWEPAFAVTVHKSQGSECDEAVIVLPEAGNRLLSREILYTAVTRARKSVCFLGSEAALRQAVGRRQRRFSGLREYFGTAPLS